MTANPPDAGAAERQGTSAFRSRTWVSWTVTVLLGFLFNLACLTYLATDLVSGKLLDPGLYTRALEENDIYNRIYTELLADPAMEEATARLLGGTILEGHAEAVFSLATSTLYLVLPPQTIKSAVEGATLELTAYLKGETERLEARLDLSSRLNRELLQERILDALATVLAERLAGAMPVGVESAAESDLDIVALAAYAEELSQGRLAEIPPGVFTTSPVSLSDEEREAAADVLLAPLEGEVPPLLRLQVEAALAAGDLPSAVVMASRALLGERVSQAAAELADDFRNSESFDAQAGAVTYLGESEEKVIAQLNAARDLVSFLDRRLIPLMIGVMAIALALIVWLHGEDIVTVLRAAGVTFLIAGGLAVILWLALRLLLRAWLPALFEGSAGAIPPSLENMVRDVLASLAAEFWSSVWGNALVVAVAGGILIGLSYISNIAGLVERLLRPVWPQRRVVLVGLAALIVIVPLLLRAIREALREEKLPCNGYVELCDRPFNQVAFAATHNSMSIADYGWLWPSHDGSVTNQLNSGIRAFLIDTHYWDAAASLSTYLRDVPPSVRAVAEKALALVPFEKKEGTFLCHIMCQLGGTPLPETLGEVRRFLESHPREVVALVIEDKITAEDTAVAFEESGLQPYLYIHDRDEPWPTLGEMIARDKRLVVMAEVEGPPPVWYHHVWDYTEETPYSFSSAEKFSCEPNRGDTDKPLFLLNHWIERVSPSRVDAARVNEYGALLGRARKCAAERGQIPNFVAVNFHLSGDVVAVVNTLNGVRGDTQP